MAIDVKVGEPVSAGEWAKVLRRLADDVEAARWIDEESTLVICVDTVGKPDLEGIIMGHHLRGRKKAQFWLQWDE